MRRRRRSSYDYIYDYVVCVCKSKRINAYGSYDNGGSCCECSKRSTMLHTLGQRLAFVLASLDQSLKPQLSSSTLLSQHRFLGWLDNVQPWATVGGHLITEPIVVSHGVVVGIAPLSVVVDNVLSVDAVKIKTKFESRLL